MPEELITTYVEKGFFAALGFILTASLTIVGFQFKTARDFRTTIHSKIDSNNNTIHKRVTDEQRHVSENHPSNADFAMMMDTMNKGFDRVSKDIRELRSKS